MSMQVVFNARAFVYKLDLSLRRYIPIANDACDIELVSINPRAGGAPERKLLAFEKGRDVPFLVIDFNSNVFLQQARGPALNTIKIHSASEIKDFLLQAVGQQNEILEFSEWLHRFADRQENLCSLLAETIRFGDEKKAIDLVSELARRKSKVALREVFDEDESKAMDASIKVTVHIEDKQCRSPVLIKLDVDPNITDVGTLKRMLHEKYSIPINVQRWVIGKRLPKDHELLKKLEVKTAGTVIYLYLLSANDASIREEKDVRAIADRVSNKARSLPPRDYRSDAAVAPPLNAKLHGYATVPCNLNRASDVQRHGADFRIPQQEEFPVQPSAADRNYAQQQVSVPVVQLAASPATDGAPPIPKPLLENQGWKCPACTYINIPTRPGCEQCCGSRPADYKMPPNFEIDEGERQRLEEVAFQDQLAHNFEESAKELQRYKALQNYQETLIVANQALVPNREPFDCPICFDNIGIEEGVVLRECLHKICRDCLKDHIRNSDDPEIPCPCSEDGADCRQVITAQEIQAILPEEEYLRYLQLSVNAAETRAANSFHCRTTNCRGWCFYEDEVNWFDCDICQKRNCLTCKAIHENMTCKEYQDDLKRRADNEDTAKRTQEMLEELIRKGDAMKCPQCSVVLQKKDGCDWMRCSMCRTEICWATKGRRWGPKGNGDTSGGCKCTPSKRCHPRCGNCH